jgi:hypothetical protein
MMAISIYFETNPENRNLLPEKRAIKLFNLPGLDTLMQKQHPKH